jgi:hypothetical protein
LGARGRAENTLLCRSDVLSFGSDLADYPGSDVGTIRTVNEVSHD